VRAKEGCVRVDLLWGDIIIQWWSIPVVTSHSCAIINAFCMCFCMVHKQENFNHNISYLLCLGIWNLEYRYEYTYKLFMKYYL
jgi:hypothetical protein